MIPFAKAGDIRDDVPMLVGEHLTRPSKAGHHLIEDKEDAILVTDLPDLLPISIGWNDLASPAADGLSHEGRHRLGALLLDGVTDEVGAHQVAVGIGVFEGAPVTVGAGNVLKLLHDDESGRLPVSRAPAYAHVRRR